MIIVILIRVVLMNLSLGERIYSFARAGDQSGLTFLKEQNGQAFQDNINWCHPRNGQQTPLYTACKYGRSRACMVLLESGASLRCADDSGINCFQIACSEGKTLTVEECIKKDPGIVNVVSQQGGFSPLYLAALNGRLSTAKVLLSKGASLSVTDANGCNAMMAACIGNHVELMRLFLLHDVFIEHTSIINGMSALHLAACYGKVMTLFDTIVHSLNAGTLSR